MRAAAKPPPPTAQARGLDRVYDLLGVHRGQNLCQRGIPAAGQVFIHIVRIDKAAVSKSDLHLAGVEGDLFKRGHLGQPVELGLHRPVKSRQKLVPPEAHERPLRVQVAFGNALYEFARAFGGHPPVKDPRQPRNQHVNHRLGLAQAHAAGLPDGIVQPSFGYLVFEGLHDILGPVCQAAGAEAHADAYLVGVKALARLLLSGRKVFSRYFHAMPSPKCSGRSGRTRARRGGEAAGRLRPASLIRLRPKPVIVESSPELLQRHPAVVF